MEAGKRVITDIFNGNKILEIPFFQRAYVWKEEQWERLLTDMEYITQTKRPYFLGSVIFKQQLTPTGAESGEVRTVIDGQQRLTTLSLFFKALYLKLGKASSFDRLFLLESGDPVLRHNYNDRADFEYIMKLPEMPEQMFSGNSRIIQAFEYFWKHVDPQKLDVESIKSHAMFVVIDLQDSEDEQQIFDTINSLGVRLTTGELLKNYFFSKQNLETYEKKWKPIFEADAECREYWDQEITSGRVKRNNLEFFFYAYLQIKLQSRELRVKTEDKNLYGRIEGVFNSYKSFIDKYRLSKEELIDEITEYAAIYKKHFDPEILGRSLTSECGIERINTIVYGLEHSTIIPYVLYVLKNVPDAEERNAIFQYLEAYLLRRLVCKSSTKNYNNLFSENLIGNEILTFGQLRTYIESRSDQVNSMPDDDAVKMAFRQSVLTNKQAAGVLYMMESRIRNKTHHSTALLGLNAYSLEHLMPKKWEKHWPRLASEAEIKRRNNMLLTLGNLAIITGSLNSSIRNADWGTKRNGRNSNRGLSYYASGIETLYDALQTSVWDEDAIIERADKLAALAVAKWQ